MSLYDFNGLHKLKYPDIIGVGAEAELEYYNNLRRP